MDQRSSLLTLSLASAECPACGSEKARRNSVCIQCWKKLPKNQQVALYRQVGHGYEGAFDNAMQTLGVAKPRLPWWCDCQQVNLSSLDKCVKCGEPRPAVPGDGLVEKLPGGGSIEGFLTEETWRKSLKPEQTYLVCRPLVANVPIARPGCEKTPCPICGQDCWKLPIEPDPLPANVKPACTRCALAHGRKGKSTVTDAHGQQWTTGPNPEPLV